MPEQGSSEFILPNSLSVRELIEKLMALTETEKDLDVVFEESYEGYSSVHGVTIEVPDGWTTPLVVLS